MANDELLSASLSGTALLILLQLSSRLVTFALNQILLRLTSPQVFGTVAIQLELLLNTILFLSREGVRGALLRSGKDNDRQRIYNTAGLPLLLGIPLAVIVSYAYERTALASVTAQPHFVATVWLYAASAILELLAGPMLILCQSDMNFRLRVSIEGMAVVVKALTTLAFIARFGQDSALLGFALGQVAFSLVIVVRYAWTGFRDEGISLWPRKIGKSRIDMSYFDSSALTLAFALTKQSVVKQFLTEGDKFIVSRISAIDDQGGYALALNYGSLVIRILFQPVEESARVYFSKLLASSDPNKANASDQKKDTTLLGAANLLATLCHVHLLLGLFLTAICPIYVRPLLSLVLGQKWVQTSAPAVLRAYCYFIPLLGLNGITEAFVQAVANEAEVASMSWWMSLWSIVYVAACFVLAGFTSQKEVGLIQANMTNMACRIGWAMWFIYRWFGRRDGSGKMNAVWRSILPPGSVLVVFGLAAVVIRLSAGKMDMMHHFGLGVACAVVCGSTILITERSRLASLKTALRP